MKFVIIEAQEMTFVCTISHVVEAKSKQEAIRKVRQGYSDAEPLGHDGDGRYGGSGYGVDTGDHEAARLAAIADLTLRVGQITAPA